MGFESNLEIDSSIQTSIQGKTQLPSDLIKTPTTGYQAQYHRFVLPEPLTEGLRAFAQRVGINPRVVLLAAFHALLYRYTQQETIQLKLTIASDPAIPSSSFEICTPITAELEVGQFIQTIATTLNQIDQSSGAKQEGLLVTNEFNQGSDLPIAIWFEQVLADDTDQLLSLLQQRADDLIAAADVEVRIVEAAQAISGLVRFNANLFNPETIERLIGHWCVVLGGIVHHPEYSISQLPLLTLDEVQQLVMVGNGETVLAAASPLHHGIEAHAEQQPEAIAVSFREQTLSYAELNHRANQLAHYLIELGVQAEVSVAVCVEPSVDILVCLLAIFKAGGVYLPLDPTYPLERLSTIIEETQPQVFLTQAPLMGKLPPISTDCFCLDTDWGVLEQMPAANPELEIDLEQTAYLIYTSGTTGKPKGVMASYGNLVNYIQVARSQFGFERSMVMPAIARFTFSITFFELLSPVVAGGRLVILERDHILDFNRLVQTLTEVSVLHASPSLLRKLLAYIRANHLDMGRFNGLRHVSSGGDIVAPDVLEAMQAVFQQAEIFVIYGCSEISCMGCFYPVPKQHAITQTRVGQPFDNVSVRLYDPQQNLVPIGIVGEIYFSGGGITRGYLKRPELTQEKFVTIEGERFYRTGDLGRWDATGNLEILGRSDFQIKVRGIRIELGEIESTLRHSAPVREVVVVARNLWNGEPGLVAYMVPELGVDLAIAEIRRYLQSKLPDYMVPAAFVVLEALPVNLNGKLDRKALPEPTPENLAQLNPYVAARNQSEQQLTQIWETVLGISPIGIEDNFFEIGGDSLLSVTLMAEIEKVFAQTLPLSTLLTEPTIAQLAALLSQSGQSEARNSLVLLRSGGSKPPIFLIHDGEGETLLYRNLAYCLSQEHPVYGIQPHSRAGHPILHTRIGEMATYYREQIRQVQPEGPYLLGGLCVGGFLAFEIARQLQNQGQPIGMIALIDTADVEATLRSGLMTSQRLTSFSKSLRQGQYLSWQRRLFYLLSKASQKIGNLIAYEVRTKVEKTQNQIKMKWFRYYLDQGLPVPQFLQNIPVRIALKFAEREYIPQEQYRGEVVLFRATEKSSIFDGTLIDDTPYADIYSDPLLGWEKRATAGVKVYDIPGGHSSMLQESNVQVLADKMQAYIDRVIAPVSALP